MHRCDTVSYVSVLGQNEECLRCAEKEWRLLNSPRLTHPSFVASCTQALTFYACHTEAVAALPAPDLALLLANLLRACLAPSPRVTRTPSPAASFHPLSACTYLPPPPSRMPGFCLTMMLRVRAACLLYAWHSLSLLFREVLPTPRPYSFLLPSPSPITTAYLC